MVDLNSWNPDLEHKTGYCLQRPKGAEKSIGQCVYRYLCYVPPLNFATISQRATKFETYAQNRLEGVQQAFG